MQIVSLEKEVALLKERIAVLRLEMTTQAKAMAQASRQHKAQVIPSFPVPHTTPSILLADLFGVCVQ